MNTAKLARTTFVIDRTTHDQLNMISRRMGVSRSEFVRDVLAEPVAMMAGWVEAVPEKPTEADAAQLLLTLRGDLGEFIASKVDELGGPLP
jgi:dolichyl-phosphate-mannose--protein O-mannosyl transferase